MQGLRAVHQQGYRRPLYLVTSLRNMDTCVSVRMRVRM